VRGALSIQLPKGVKLRRGTRFIMIAGPPRVAVLGWDWDWQWDWDWHWDWD
jgi:hypothetical protein